MKLQQNTYRMEIGTAMPSNAFGIEMNAKAFKVLTSTLYTDKIGSLIREYSCNAYDAHAVAGKKDTPFEIHLPDTFEPWFSVKDYGTGLTPEEVKNVFCVFFKSSKEQSNDVIGCFGLGSKSALSYTDQFTVESRKDGLKTIYSVFLQPDGTPTVMQLHQELTEASDGLEIKISVKEKDFGTFASKAKEQLSFFEVPPVLTNNTYGVKLGFDQEPSLQNSYFKLWQSNSALPRSGVYLVQGNVGYVLSPHLLNEIEGVELAQHLRWTNANSCLALMFDIGEIGVTASREAPEFTEITLAAIKAKMLKVQENICSDLMQNLADAENDFARMDLLVSLRKTGMSWVVDKVIEEIQVLYPRILLGGTSTNRLFVPEVKDSFTDLMRSAGYYEVKAAGGYYNTASCGNLVYGEVRWEVLASKPCIVLCAAKRMSKQKMDVVAASQKRNALVFNLNEKGIKQRNQLKASFQAAFPKYDVYIDKEIQVQKNTTTRTSTTRSKDLFYYMVEDRNGKLTSIKTPFGLAKFNDLNEARDAYYVEYTDGSLRNYYNLFRNLFNLQSIVGVVPVVFVHTRFKDEVAKVCKPLQEYVDNEFKTLAAEYDEELHKEYVAENLLYRAALGLSHREISILNSLQQELPASPLLAAAKPLLEARHWVATDRQTRMNQIANLLGKVVDQAPSAVTAVFDRYSASKKNYPLLDNLLKSYHFDVDLPAILQYIKDTDELTEYRLSKQLALAA